MLRRSLKQLAGQQAELQYGAQVQCAALDMIPLIPAAKLTPILAQGTMHPQLLPALRSPMRYAQAAKDTASTLLCSSAQSPRHVQLQSWHQCRLVKSASKHVAADHACRREVRAAAVATIGALPGHPAQLAAFAAYQNSATALQECVGAVGDALLDSAGPVCAAAHTAAWCGLQPCTPAGAFEESPKWGSMQAQSMQQPGAVQAGLATRG